MGDGVQATVRTGELINADGSTGFTPDTLVGSAAVPSDSAPALRTAILIARGQASVGSPGTRHLANLTSVPRGAARVTDASWNAAHYPIMGARLLAAFKVWGTLRAFHAYNDLRDENLDDALFRVIPRVEAATEAYSYAAAMLDFASATNDGQVRLSSPTLEQHLGAAAAPFKVRWVQSQGHCHTSRRHRRWSRNRTGYWRRNRRGRRVSHARVH